MSNVTTNFKCESGTVVDRGSCIVLPRPYLLSASPAGMSFAVSGELKETEMLPYQQVLGLLTQVTRLLAVRVINVALPALLLLCFLLLD